MLSLNTTLFQEKEIQEYKYDNISSSGLSEAPPQIFGKPDSNGESSFGVKQCGSEQETVEEEEQSRFTWPDSLFDRIIYVLSFPYLVAFALTIPDCGKGSEIYSCCGNSTTIRWEKLYVGTFFMSIVWIALLTVGRFPNKQQAAYHSSLLLVNIAKSPEHHCH